MNSKTFVLKFKFFGDVTVIAGISKTTIYMNDSFNTEIWVTTPSEELSLDDWYEFVLEEINDCIDTEGCY